jgi:ribosomal protein L11 methyltransferase
MPQCWILKLKAKEVENVSTLAWEGLPELSGIEECNETGQPFQSIPTDLEISEFGTEAAQKTSDYLAQHKFSQHSSVFLKLYFQSEFKDESGFFANLLTEGLVESFQSEVLPVVDYFTEFKKNFKGTLLGGDVWLGPPWDQEIPEVAFRLFVEPGMAFGTGDHPTTQLCVKKLNELRMEGLPNSKAINVLDVGTGTGILAIATRKFFPNSQILAIDLDSLCQENFLTNLKLNEIPAQSVNMGFGPEYGNLKFLSGQYDLIVSNIYAEVLVSLFEDIKRCLKPGGLWLSSGILEGPSEEVLLNKTDGQIKILDRQSQKRAQDTWVMYLMKSY